MDLSLFSDIHSKDELRQKIRNEIIKYVNQDGIKIVDPNYIEYIKNIDTFKLGQELSPFEQQESIKNTLFSMQLQTYIKEEIALLTGDLSAKSKPQEFLEAFKKFGFQIIYDRSIDVDRNLPFKNEKEYMEFVKSNKGFIENNSSNDEIKLREFNYTATNFEYVLFNKENSFLIHMDTYDGIVNQIRLLGMIKDINPEYYPPNSHIFKADHYSKIYTVDMDLLELPIDSYWKLISNCSHVKDWTTFKIHLDSCLDELSPLSTLEKVKKFPQHVLDRVVFKQHEFGSNIQINSIKEEKFKDFFKKIEEEDVQDYILRTFLFRDYNIEEAKNYIFNQNIINLANQEGYKLSDLIDRHTYTAFNKYLNKNVDLFFSTNNFIFNEKLKNIDIDLFKFVDVEKFKNKVEKHKGLENLLPVIENMKSIYHKQIKILEPKRSKLTLN